MYLQNKTMTEKISDLRARAKAELDAEYLKAIYDGMSTIDADAMYARASQNIDKQFNAATEKANGGHSRKFTKPTQCKSKIRKRRKNARDARRKRRGYR